MSKYDKITEYLSNVKEETVNITYTEIEKLIGSSLPDYARNDPEIFWANTSSKNGKFWMSVGYETDMVSDTTDLTIVPEQYIIFVFRQN